MTSEFVEDGTAGAETRNNLNLFTDSVTLRATEKLESLTFTYDHGSAEKKGTVTLTIPRTWTRAVRDNSDGVDEEGEIEVEGANSYSVTSGGGGWQVKATMTDDPPYTTTTITYKKVTVPNRAGRYEFGISSTTAGDGHTASVNPHSTKGHAIEADDPNDPPADYHKHSADSTGVIGIEVAPHDHDTDRTHQHGDDGHVVNTAGHDHATTQDHGHDATDKTVNVVEGHNHPHDDGVGQHEHHETSGLITTKDLHSHSDNDANEGTHVHGPDNDVITGAAHDNSHIDGAMPPTVISMTTTTARSKILAPAIGMQEGQDGDTGDHEHGADGTLTRVDTHDGAGNSHSHVEQGGEVSSPGANHMHGANGNHDHLDTTCWQR